MIIEKPRHNHSDGAIAKNSFTEGQAAVPVVVFLSISQYSGNTVWNAAWLQASTAMLNLRSFGVLGSARW